MIKYCIVLLLKLGRVEKKKLLVLLLALLMIVGCSSADPKPAEDPKPTEPAPSTGNEDPAPSDEVTDMTAEITWWAFSTFATVDDTSGKYEESLVAKFNEKHPNIKVNVEMIGFQNGPERIITAIQGGTAPDVLFDAPGRIIDYGRAGDLVALDDMIEETGLKDDITPEYILQPSLDGTNYWMYPTSTAPFVMAVNKTSLEKESLFDKVPQEGARTLTTAEFEELSKEMQAKCYKGVEIYAGDQGGAAGIRAQSVNDINEIMSVVDLPVIGIIKRNYEDSEIYITATRKEVEELLTTNCQMIA